MKNRKDKDATKNRTSSSDEVVISVSSSDSIKAFRNYLKTGNKSDYVKIQDSISSSTDLKISELVD